MKLRDTLNTKEGYEEIINKFSFFIKKDYDDLNTYHSEFDVKKIRDTYSSMFKYNIDILKTEYSLGKERNKIIDTYNQILKIIEKCWEAESGYLQMVWMLSIGIMLEIDNKAFNKLIELVERDDLKDYLIDFLIRYRRPSWQQTNSFLWNKPYSSISEIVELSQIDKEKALIRLKKYLTKEWYKGQDYKDTHKSKWNIHTGYWSFESGAITKILSLEDNSLKNLQYYPYDMLHWKEQVD